jgi:hypothetical protein
MAQKSSKINYQPTVLEKMGGNRVKWHTLFFDTFDA